MDISPATQEFIKEHRQDDVRQLALKAHVYPEVDMLTAITQIAGRQAVAAKIPSWHQVDELQYPVHLSLEQCSSEVTARYKASLLKGDSLVDLTGGFGVDCAFMAKNFRQVTYVERQEELCEIAEHNFVQLGLSNISVFHKDSVSFLREMNEAGCIFIDPARRSRHGRKIIKISDCEPNVEELETVLLEKGKEIMIKLSPMLDLSQALQSLTAVGEVHVVSVRNECKELLLLLRSEKPGNTPIHCINIDSNGEKQAFIFTVKEEADATCIYTNDINRYLYEPNASLLKAGAFKSIGARYSLKKLHPNSHLYTSDELVERFPGRKFLVLADSLGKMEKGLFPNLQKANVATRNYPLAANDLRKKLNVSDGGDIYLFGTTLSNNKKVVIKCEKL